MSLASPRVCPDADLPAAHRAALDATEPIMVPVDLYADDRGWSIMNQFQGVLAPEGQINVSIMYPGVVKAWHRHRRQTDFFLGLHGNLKAGVHRDDGTSWLTYLGEKRPQILIIPPTLWHGLATVGPESAGLLYYINRRYDPSSPDEERRPWDDVDGFPWDVQFR